MTIKRHYLYLPGLLLLLLALIPERTKLILPSHEKNNFRLQTYVDYLDTTRGSMGKTILSDSLLVFEYTLRTVNHSAAIKPVSGFTLMFDVHSTGHFLDVSKYDYLDIEVTMKDASSFLMYIKTFEHFTDTNVWFTQRYTEQEIVLAPRISRYRLSFKKFSTPHWWKTLIGSKTLTLPKRPDYSKVMAIDFQNNPGGAVDIPERMEIRRIEFHKDRRLFYFMTAGLGLLWIILINLIIMLRRKKRGHTAVAEKPIKPVSLVNQSEEQLNRLVLYIGSNFQNSELSVEMAATETGIGHPKISTLLQQKYRMNFKQYLNDVRISESKRLLKESDRSIAEIAFAVGYNSIPHFNRVFRQHTEITPTEYREQHRHDKSE